ncbi:MAG: hypothetical protein BWY84_00207 [Candidatus Aerophobetes bacterium ADurb.Bin490]|nr:MAG: hypothetical protein BWY84_00207 [Candidatus Aerophobetes bacterium ADurb.Bin490]HNZ30159.1 DUF6448 family protein [Candidatus Goldiibacteriota bacterium]HPI04509.1 DUF6448 family protein [Candidatus Goldiibacteriota bacterium]HPN64505.1 DUF6448 family protein [Candidatus Goldiibacteriota bacterium]HRQ44125.1 DUF6448 family protein [Candidatus Goldiibacteriota bacterium]
MNKTAVLALSLVLTVLFSASVLAHCDTVEGPLIKEAKAAFEKKDVTPVLKWVKKNDEKEIKLIFAEAQKAAAAGAKEIAEKYFLENLVRVHRVGEGASYTGIKPEGTKIDAAVLMGDKALEKGSVKELTDKLTEHITAEVNKRFENAVALRKTADKSPEQGRKYIEAYISYIHLVENLHGLIKSESESGHKH